MNTEVTETGGDNWQLAFPMNFGSASTSDPNWEWMLASPRPVFFDAEAETHTDWLFSGVGGEFSDIVTDDLNRPTSRKNTLAAEPKEQIAQAQLTKMANIVLVNVLRSNAQFSVFAVSEMIQWINWAFVTSRTPSSMNDVSRPTGLQVEFMPEIEEKKKKSQQVLQAYSVRLKYLRSEAELDGFSVNQASEKDFWLFFRSTPFLRKAGVILMDNGNLRAVWRGEDTSRLGIQFLGNQSVEYVIFKRRQDAKEVSRAAGFDTLDGFKKQIQAFDLKALVYT